MNNSQGNPGRFMLRPAHKAKLIEYDPNTSTNDISLVGIDLVEKRLPTLWKCDPASRPDLSGTRSWPCSEACYPRAFFKADRLRRLQQVAHPARFLSHSSTNEDNSTY